jgi:hypothetical protein
VRSIYLYFFLCCLPINAVAIPEPITICLWEAEIASNLQFGRRFDRKNDVLWHRAVVEILLERDKNPPFFIKKVLNIFDTVWLQYNVEDDESLVFKNTYSTCIYDYKNEDSVYYY